MLLKEMGVPIPIPSDLIMITAGVEAATGQAAPLALLFAVAAATFIGGSVQYILLRAAGRPAIQRLGPLVGLTPDRVDAAGRRLQSRGATAIFVGLNIPGARAGIIPAASLGGISYAAFAPAMFAGGFVFYLWHMALGFILGPSATALFSRLNVTLLPIVLALIILGAIGWLILHRRHHGAGSAAADAISWTEAACPLCLALAAVAENTPKPKQDKA